MGILHHLSPSRGTRRIRVGRGESSGRGKTAGRGHKGARARSGYHPSPVTSGIPWYRKLPMRGFSNNRFRQRPAEVTLQQLAELSRENVVVDFVLLRKKGLIPSSAKTVKVIGNQCLETAVTVQAHAFSRGAREAIERAGGRVVVVSAETPLRPQVAAEESSSEEESA